MSNTNVGDRATAIAKRDSAIDAIKAKAAELRKTAPNLSEAQSFAKAFRANGALAAEERTAARAALYA